MLNWLVKQQWMNNPDRATISILEKYRKVGLTTMQANGYFRYKLHLYN